MKRTIYSRFFKRPLDLFISLVALVILIPVFLIVALLVKFKLGSPIIFKQSRPGLNEKIFQLYKFRSMTNEKDEYGNLLPDDKRLTKFGKFLRSTSLDELPSLINIVKGDMSIVGPRPLLVKYIPLYNDTQRLRHCVRPGLTGLAQVKGRNFLDWKTKFTFDVIYVKNITLYQDFVIILMTFFKVALKEGIVSSGENTTIEFLGNSTDSVIISEHSIRNKI